MVELTFVHASTESGDDQYFVFDELLDSSQAKQKIDETAKEQNWDDRDFYIEYVEQVVR